MISLIDNCIKKHNNYQKQKQKSKLEKIYEDLKFFIESKVNVSSNLIIRQVKQLKKISPDPDFQKLLKKIAKAFIQLELLHDYPEEISERIDRIMNALILPTKESQKNTEKKIPIFNFLLFFDISSFDYNSSILGSICHAIREKVPFFTTTSSISGQDLLKEKSPFLKWNFSMLKDSINKWEIYRSKEILLFLPIEKKLSLKKLGLDENKLIKIKNIKKIFNTPDTKPTLSDFLDVFIPKIRSKKRIFLKGHGNATTFMGGLTFEEYRKLLQFLDENDGEFLCISSCKSGAGKNSFQHYVVKNGTRQGVHFPIAVRNIGAYDAGGDDFKASDFLELEDLMDRCGHSIPLKDFAARIKKTKNCKLEFEKDIYSAMQIQFPHTGEYLERGGFRPVGELESCYALTYSDLQRKKLECSINFGKEALSRTEHGKKSPEIQLDEKDKLLILPLIIDIPIFFASYEPTLISMIPENAHHFFLYIQLNDTWKEDKIPLSDFFGTMKKFCTEENKAFFIRNLHCDKKYFQVVIAFFNKNILFLYGKNKKKKRCYWIENDCGKSSISEEKFVNLAFQIALDTKPKEESIRLATGGQQSEDDFKNILESQFFDNDNNSLSEAIKIYKKFAPKLFLSKKDKNKLQKLSHSLQKELLIFAIQGEHIELINALLKISKINKDIIDYKGCNIFFKAFQTENERISNTLLEAASQLNNKRRKIFFYKAAHICLRENRPHLLEKLFEYYPLNVDKFNELTLLEKSFYTGDFSLVKRIDSRRKTKKLKDSHALILAIRVKEIELVRWFFKKSPSINQTDKFGNYPLVVAAEHGTADILSFFTQLPHIDLNVRNEDGETPLLVAARKGLRNHVKILINSGANLTVKDNKKRNIYLHAIDFKDVKLLHLLQKKQVPLDLPKKKVRKLIIELITSEENQKIVEILFLNKKPPEFSFKEVSDLIAKGIPIENISKGRVKLKDDEVLLCKISSGVFLHQLPTLIEWNKKGLKPSRKKFATFSEETRIESSILNNDQEIIEFFKILFPENVIQLAYQRIEKRSPCEIESKNFLFKS